MSTTSSGDEHPSIPRPVKYKRRKIALIFAYCGVGYQGMQKNPGAKTIEGDLEEALFHSGAVPEQDRGCPQRYEWARSARTDKGVSAVGQVVSGRFYIDPPGLVDRLNDILPAQFRIFGYKRVSPSFSAKKFCDKRRDINITVPTAPEVGLYLDECFFTSYNKKWIDTHEEVSMKAYAEEAEDFKMKHIYSHIASMEHKEGSVGLWLHSLNYRNYPDLRVSDNKVNSDGGPHEAENKHEAILAENIVSSDERPLEVENKHESVVAGDTVSSDGKPHEDVNKLESIASY